MSGRVNSRQKHLKTAAFAFHALHLNADFLPGVSISDVGSGILPLVGLLALTPLQSVRRNWVVTSALAALIIFVANVVFI